MRAEAPVRVADVGGWTDTWFAPRGAVTNVAVGPGAWAEVRVGRGTRAPVVIRAADLGRAPHRIELDEAPPTGSIALLDHAVRDWAGRLPAGALGPDGASLEVAVGASVPPGSSLGTSASVLVALLAALHAVGGGEATAEHLAREAHRIETGPAGRQSGVQDHVAAALGGISALTMVGYPDWQRREVIVSSAVGAALDEVLLTVHLGATHDSSALHQAVIARAESGEREVTRVLAALAAEAERAADALDHGDLRVWAATLSAATDLQADLHPDLVPAAARQAIDAATRRGAWGIKVNGAGGLGGTLTLIVEPGERAGLLAALSAAVPGAVELALVRHGGVRVIARR